jgi:hypothetical protein
MLERAAQEPHLLAYCPAAAAKTKMNGKRGVLPEAERSVFTLGHQSRRFAAGKIHRPNQFFSKHSRSAMRAR